MKVKITLPDGRIIEAEGDAEEIRKLLPDVQAAPITITWPIAPIQFVPCPVVTPPWRFIPSKPFWEIPPTYIGDPAEPYTITCEARN